MYRVSFFIIFAIPMLVIITEENNVPHANPIRVGIELVHSTIMKPKDIIIGLNNSEKIKSPFRVKCVFFIYQS